MQKTYVGFRRFHFERVLWSSRVVINNLFRINAIALYYLLKYENQFFFLFYSTLSRAVARFSYPRGPIGELPSYLSVLFSKTRTPG